mmetsp:Transcript_15495/g.35893  ORF Transcript_15495/g.35893 Transcript_15495/m.35893 type:complete len:367 (-) Transcript_15495:262-1362(-)
MSERISGTGSGTGSGGTGFVRRSTLWSLPVLNAVFGVGLCVIHAHAENSTTESSSSSTTSSILDGAVGGGMEQQQRELFPDAWDRIASGPLHWSTTDKILFFALILLALEILNFLCNHSGDWMNVRRIPVRGKHLDEFTPKDHLFIGISKAQTGPFLYFMLRYCFHEPNMIWTFGDDDFCLKTVLAPLPVFFFVYDFFYTLLHGFLHVHALYPYIHQHHHVQKAPSRATDDAVNVHPIEFTLGEYNHLWTIYLCCSVVGLRVHVLAPLLFLSIGGILAGWNHTRFDLSLKVLGVTVFDSKAHDVHHRIPQSNYGQYTMFWDWVFGSYRPYDPNDKVNPKAQLDPATGKSLTHAYLRDRAAKAAKAR